MLELSRGEVHIRHTVYSMYTTAGLAIKVHQAVKSHISTKLTNFNSFIRNEIFILVNYKMDIWIFLFVSSILRLCRTLHSTVQNASRNKQGRTWMHVWKSAYAEITLLILQGDFVCATYLFISMIRVEEVAFYQTMCAF